MRRLGIWILVLSCVIACGACRTPRSDEPAPPTPPPPGSDGTPRVVVESTTRFQTMSGWEATSQAGHDESPHYLAYKHELLDRAVDDLGIDRLRVEILSGAEHARDNYGDLLAGRISEEQWRPLRYETVNDNDDPFTLNERGFWFTALDNTIEKVVLPLRERLEARGRRLFLNVCYVAFTGQIQSGRRYDHADPEEYAEFVQAVFQHLANRYGLVPDAWEMHLEPDNTREWTADYMRRAMIATGNRLKAMGLSPGLIAPSTTNMARALDYADVIARGGLPPLWSTLSYHRYGGVSDAVLREIGARQRQLGIETAMLEHLSSGYESLHQDLKVGQVSAWQQFALAFPGEAGDGVYLAVDTGNPSAPSVRLTPKSTFLAQYFKYIRRGAVRTQATSSDTAFDPVGFVNPDGKYVLVVLASRGGEFDVQGLPGGDYDVSYTTGRDANVGAGALSASPAGTVRLQMPDRGVLTIAGR